MTTKDALDHAWGWFTLHATQRLQSVNFYLVAVGFLSAAFVTAAEADMHALAGGVAVLAVCISLFIYRMERRIRSLIHASEDALRPLQAITATSLSIDAMRIVEKVEHPKAGEWKYSKALGYLYLTTGSAFVLGLLYVAWSAAASTPAGHEFAAVIQTIIGMFLVFAGYELLVGLPPGDQPKSNPKWLMLVIGASTIIAGVFVLMHLVFCRL